jgi:hypothetical protein
MGRWERIAVLIFFVCFCVFFVGSLAMESAEPGSRLESIAFILLHPFFLFAFGVLTCVSFFLLCRDVVLRESISPSAKTWWLFGFFFVPFLVPLVYIVRHALKPRRRHRDARST